MADTANSKTEQEKIVAAKRSRVATLEESIAERQDPRSDLSKWFCPASGDMGCAGPRCPRFYVGIAPDEKKRREEIAKEYAHVGIHLTFPTEGDSDKMLGCDFGRQTIRVGGFGPRFGEYQEAKAE